MIVELASHAFVDCFYILELGQIGKHEKGFVKKYDSIVNEILLMLKLNYNGLQIS